MDPLKDGLHPAYYTSDHCSGISINECAKSYPWMTDLLNRSFETAVFKVNDYSLDSRKFCNQLEKMSIANGVEFHYKTEVAEIIVEDQKAKGIKLTNGSIIPADLGRRNFFSSVMKLF